MTMLIEGLLLLARGGAPKRPEILDVRTVLDDGVRATAPLAAERGSTVQLDPGPPMLVKTDRIAIRQALVNLLGNALEHTPSGTAVRVRCDPEAKGVALRVIDNGPGIPAEARASVFQPFFRLKTTGSDGSGLGLAITRELITGAGGTVRLEETPGGGTTATVWLPCAQ
jgi:signal transduction histidine kinase